MIPIGMFFAEFLTYRQDLAHLITNAFQEMDGKGGKVVLSKRILEGSIEEKVSHEGIVIPQKYLNQVFDPFFTTRTPGDKPWPEYRLAHRGQVHRDGQCGEQRAGKN